MTTPNRNPFHGAPVPRRNTLPPVAAPLDNSPQARARRALDRAYVDRAPTVRDVDLRKVREGLGLSPQYAAALSGLSDLTILNCESKGEDTAMIHELLAIYALHMAATWGADILHLDENNLSDVDDPVGHPRRSVVR